MNDLVPKSIQSLQTTSIDKTWEDRVRKLNVESLLINIESESDPIKLEYWLQMFGIDTSIFDFSRLNEMERRLLMSNWITILRESGNEYSIKAMATVLGAINCVITYGSVLLHDGSATRNGMYFHDGGAIYSRFSIKVQVWGISTALRNDFENNFRKLMKAVQPVRIHLNSIIFM